MIYEFNPKQDLHGYSKPWAPGDGINFCDITKSFYYVEGSDILKVDQTGYHANIFANVNGSSPIPAAYRNALVLPAGTYCASYKIVSGAATSLEIESVDNSTGARSPITSSATASLPDGRLYTNFTIESETSVTLTRVGNLTTSFTNIMIEEISEITDKPSPYAPYANICPLEGYNIWDPSNDEMIQVYSGYVDANANKLYLHPVYEEYNDEELVGPWMSSMDEYTEEGTPTEGAFVIDFGGEVTEYDITDFMLQTLLDSLGIRRFITSGAMLLNSLMDQAQGRVRSEAELLNRSLPIHVIAIGKELPTNLVINKSSDVLPGLPGKFIR